MEEIKPGRYLHCKGKEYEVIGIATHSETMEKLVVYRALYYSEGFGTNALWVRPLAMFLETVTIEGNEVLRFKFIE